MGRPPAGVCRCIDTGGRRNAAPTMACMVSYLHEGICRAEGSCGFVSSGNNCHVAAPSRAWETGPALKLLVRRRNSLRPFMIRLPWGLRPHPSRLAASHLPLKGKASWDRFASFLYKGICSIQKVFSYPALRSALFQKSCRIFERRFELVAAPTAPARTIICPEKRSRTRESLIGAAGVTGVTSRLCLELRQGGQPPWIPFSARGCAGAVTFAARARPASARRRAGWTLSRSDCGKPRGYPQVVHMGC